MAVDLIEEIKKLLNEYKNKQDWYSVCSKIVLCCIEHRRISHAIDVLQQLKVREKSSVDIVCNEIFSLVCDSNTAKLEDCLALLEAMRKEIFVQLSRTALDFLLSACVSRKDSYTAKLILKEYTNEGFPFNVTTLLRMFQVFLASGDQVDAAVILKIMSRKDRKDQHVKYLIKMDANNERLSIKCNSNKAAWSPGKYAHRRWWETEDFRTEQGARIVYFDGRLPDIAHIVAKEASERQLPIFVDAERLREGLDELLNVATYVVCSANFPQAWTEAPSIASALVAIALKLPHLKFVIVTRGEEGSEPLELGLGCHTAAICV
ncbi:hypothetical protein SUGI_0230120 [Cryptomeria japonica]|nr:hypothetical protein SUGI_0230120 [Cryptomeria japonica]